jgi:hypothetical protein
MATGLSSCHQAVDSYRGWDQLGRESRSPAGTTLSSASEPLDDRADEEQPEIPIACSAEQLDELFACTRDCALPARRARARAGDRLATDRLQTVASGWLAWFGRERS